MNSGHQPPPEYRQLIFIVKKMIIVLQKDISVVKLSAEAAPADLPPPGELSRPPLRVGMAVYAMKNAFGPWFKGKVMDITPKNGNIVSFYHYTFCNFNFLN